MQKPWLATTRRRRTNRILRRVLKMYANGHERAMNLPLSRFVGLDPDARRKLAFGADEVRQNMPAGFGTDTRQIHAHAATTTVRRSDPYRRRRRVARHLTWIGHDGCLWE